MDLPHNDSIESSPPAPAAAGGHRLRRQQGPASHWSDDSSASGSSYIGREAGASEAGAIVRDLAPCRWRSARFNDAECEHYFDCPSHQIGRHLGDRDEPAGNADGGHESDSSEDSDGDGHDGNKSMRPASSDTFGLVQTLTFRSEPDAMAEEARDTTMAPSNLLSTITSSFHQRERTEPQHRPILSGGLSIQADGSSSSPPPSPFPNFTSRPPPSRPNRPFILPRWQPDAEVTLCPICNTQFSIFVRKHHCRKCGRVVCNSCSPHRITIPHQYIVRNPAFGYPYRYPAGPSSGDGGSTDFGGERVRLCNPCVPDPNTTPPQTHISTGHYPPRQHGRSRSSLVGHPNSSTVSRYVESSGGPAGSGDAVSRSRSSTMHIPPGHSPQPSLVRPPGVHHQATAPSSSTPQLPPSRSYQFIFGNNAGVRIVPAPRRALPSPPPQIAEEDECPVCHRELPPTSLPDSETLREEHIASCISVHSAYGGSASPGSPEGCAPMATRRTGMFPYHATENDCVDSAECTICLEEFQVGDAMARLECLCRFHRSCIQAWFVGHPGRCPVHQHDGFGF